MFGNKVFSRKGRFQARDVDPPLGELTQVPEKKAPSYLPTTDEPMTSCYEGKNLRVRVLKPDAAFINDMSQRLAQLDAGVKSLKANNDSEN